MVNIHQTVRHKWQNSICMYAGCIGPTILQEPELNIYLYIFFHFHHVHFYAHSPMSDSLQILHGCASIYLYIGDISEK